MLMNERRNPVSNALPTRRSAIAALLILMLAGCGERAPTPQDPSVAPAKTSAEAALDPRDPCRLLQPQEVETALGAPLAGAPFRAAPALGDAAGTPMADGEACWYETAGLHNLTVQATWTNAGAVIAGMGGYLAKADQASGGLVTLQDGSELTGEWDEVRVLGCCIFMALRGDSVVEIDFGGSAATFEQVGTLADAALRRLEAPLAIDGRAGLAAATQRLAQRPQRGDICLWSDADIAELLGEPQGDPERSGDDCTYRYLDERNRPQMFMSTVTWRNGYRDYRQQNAMLGGMAKNLARELDGAPALQRTQSLSGPWDAAQNSAMQFNSVRADIQISLRHSKLTLDDMRALLQRAYQRLGIESGVSP